MAYLSSGISAAMSSCIYIWLSLIGQVQSRVGILYFFAEIFL